VCKDLADGQGLRCQAPSPTDGKKNGAETDVDCGGAGNPGCGTGKDCLVNEDCASLGCNYNKKCAAGRSCARASATARWGGDTCGQGGAGGIGAEAWEDCCLRDPVVPATGPTAGQTIYLDRYQVTAGRMRAFMEAIGYDVRTYVQNARAAGRIPLIPNQANVNNVGRTVLEADWDLYLPTSFAGNNNPPPLEIADCSQSGTSPPNANTQTCQVGAEQNGIYTAVSRHLGGFIFKANDQSSTGCFVGAPGTHAFRFPDGMQDGPAPDFDQDLYDTKAMQCIDYLVAQAFCVWEGGRLELGPEWVAAWGPGALPWSAVTSATPQAPGSATYWGCRFPWATDASHAACGLPEWTPAKTIEFADYQYSYEYPKKINLDYIAHISAPGRTRGRGPNGHADIIGNNYGLTSDVVYNANPHTATHGWDASGSWEVHGYAKPVSGLSRTSGLLNKYGKLGLRCAFTTPNP
jgi:hypothetical protein